MKAIAAALVVGVLVGAVLGWLWARRTLDQAMAAAAISAAGRQAEHERQLAKVRTQMDAAEARAKTAADEARAAAADAAAAHLEAQAAVLEVRRPVAPDVRARRVAARVNVTPEEVTPAPDGYRLSERALTELEAVATASASWGKEREALVRARNAERARADALALELGIAKATIERVHRDLETESLARVEAEAAYAAVSGAPWYLRPELWGTAGILIGIGLRSAIQP